MTDAEPLLVCAGVAVARAGRTILRNVELTVRAGEVVALLGPNGAGKSSLLETIGGTLAPAAGTVLRHGRVAVARQSPDLADRSVRANVELALGWWGIPRAERRPRAEAALAAIGAGGLADRSARTLSGGEQRRVHLARVLGLGADLLVLDEPFAGLDPTIRAELLADTGRVLRQLARAALVVVHDRAEAWALADRLVVVLDGAIAADGPPRELLEAPPNPAVARFLGFEGELVEADGALRLLRPSQVQLDPDGPHAATVRSFVPTEDGVRLQLDLDDGRLVAVCGLPSPRPGETVRVRLTGGVRFRADQLDPMVPRAATQSRIP